MTKAGEDDRGSWPLLTFAGQTLVVVIGWVVVNRLSARRELEKARREATSKEADDLCKLVDSIQKAACAYHCAAEPYRAAENEIKATFSDLSHRVLSLSRVAGRTNQISACSRKVIAFKRAVTERHFEDEHDGPAPKELVDELMMAAGDWRRELVNIKLDAFSLSK